MQIFGMTGEPLGQIGSSATTKNEGESPPDPEWKQVLAHTPSVSTRRGLVQVSKDCTKRLYLKLLYGLFSSFSEEEANVNCFLSYYIPSK